MLHNQIRQKRSALGWSQAELARRTGVTRQALHLVETMQVVPNTALALKLARALGGTVEDLFTDGEDSAQAWVAVATPHHDADEDTETAWHQLPPVVGDRVLVVGTGDRSLARRAPAGSAGLGLAAPLVGIVTESDPAGRVRVEHAPQSAGQRAVVVAGCDIGLGLLTVHASRSRNMAHPIVWDGVDNRQALWQLAVGGAQVAAVHYRLGDTLPPAPEAAVGPIARLHFASWQLGWLLPRGNPNGFDGAEALGGGGVRLANRPAGSGARALLDRLLTEAGVDGQFVPGYHTALGGHLQVAEAVASGLADIGIGIASAAAQTGLDFIPIQDEVCELWIPQQNLEDEGVEALCAAVCSDLFRWDLARYGPYDVARSGLQVTTVGG